MRQVSFKSNAPYSTDQAIEFTSRDNEVVMMYPSAFITMAEKVSWENKITLIKIVRGLVCTRRTEFGAPVGSLESLSLMFAKDIVEFMIEKFKPRPNW